MSPYQMMRACRAAVAAELRVDLVVLRTPRGARITLAGKGSPLGEVIRYRRSEGTTASFGAQEVLVWMSQRGMVSVDLVEDSSP